MSLSAEQWLDVLLDLGPDGESPVRILWTRDPARRWVRFWRGVAEELARIGAQIGALPDELIPSHTTDLLPEWERALGVPRCGPLAPTVAERRAALVGAMRAIGGTALDYLYSVAYGLGIAAGDITITDPYLPHVWRVEAPGAVIRMTCADTCDSPLVTFAGPGQPLFCMYQRIKRVTSQIYWG